MKKNPEQTDLEIGIEQLLKKWFPKSHIEFNLKHKFDITPLELKLNCNYSRIYLPDFVFEHNGFQYVIEVKPTIEGRFVNGIFQRYDSYKNKMTNIFMHNYIINNPKEKIIFIVIKASHRTRVKETLKKQNIQYKDYLHWDKETREKFKREHCIKIIEIYDATDFKRFSKRNVFDINKYK